MKSKKFSRKLYLNKSTVAHLDKTETANILGGATYTVEPYCIGESEALSWCICDTRRYTICVVEDTYYCTVQTYTCYECN